MKLIHLILCGLNSVFLQAQDEGVSVFPASFNFNSNAAAVNGSCLCAHCRRICIDSGTSNCTAPSTSVLFDGNIPTLTDLGRNAWARHFLTLEATEPALFTFDFSTVSQYSGVQKVEVVLFNCPAWGIHVEEITLFSANSVESSTRAALVFHTVSVTSCHFPVRVCISRITASPVLLLRFRMPSSKFSWIHLGEVKFYTNGSTCGEDAVIPPVLPHTSSPALTTDDATPCTPVYTETPPTEKDTFSVLSSGYTPLILTAAFTVLLATAIFTLLQIAICRCHQGRVNRVIRKGVELRNLRNSMGEGLENTMEKEEEEEGEEREGTEGLERGEEGRREERGEEQVYDDVVRVKKTSKKVAEAEEAKITMDHHYFNIEHLIA